jgi:hypothetical protein
VRWSPLPLLWHKPTSSDGDRIAFYHCLASEQLHPVFPQTVTL